MVKAKPNNPVRATTTGMNVGFIIANIALKVRTGGNININNPTRIINNYIMHKMAGVHSPAVQHVGTGWSEV